MKCLLIDSHWQQEEIGPRLALGCLAAAICDIVEVETIEFLFNEVELAEVRQTPSIFWSFEQRFLRAIVEKLHNDPDIRIVGVTGWSGSFPRMLRIAHCCKAANPDIVVVFGGPHVTLHERHCPSNQSILKKYNLIDYLVVGEGEAALRRLVKDLIDSSFSMPRDRIRVYQADGTTNTRIRSKCDKIAFSPRTFWEPFLSSSGTSSRMVFFVETSRGCPHRCTFCDEYELWKQYRRFDNGRVIAEIEKGIDQFGSRSFRFADSTLTANSSLKTLCKEMIRRNLRVSWSAFVHCAEITEEKAALMAEAGCKCALVGIESGVQSILDDMNKKSSRRTIEAAVRILQTQGVRVRGSFIIGYPGETILQAMATIEFAKSLGLDAYAWHVYQSPFRLLWQGKKVSQPDFGYYELDNPPEVTIRVLMREEKLLRDMHALPRLAALTQSFEPNPDKWPTHNVKLLSILRKAINEVGEEGAYDLAILATEERVRRVQVG